MLEAIFLAVVQAVTEFLPISSSGHLAFVSNLISEPNLFFFSALHAASLFAIVIFTRRELAHLFRFDEGYGRVWLYLIVGTIPAALFGFFFRDKISEAFSSFFFIGLAFIFTGVILYTTKFRTEHPEKMSLKYAFIIGCMQVLALFPGVSRSGLTISTALLLGVQKEKAIKFSFLLFIPLSLGAFILSALGENDTMTGSPIYLGATLTICFIVCLALSLLFLRMLFKIVEKGKLWVFSVYCVGIGLTALLFHFLFTN